MPIDWTMWGSQPASVPEVELGDLDIDPQESPISPGHVQFPGPVHRAQSGVNPLEEGPTDGEPEEYFFRRPVPDADADADADAGTDPVAAALLAAHRRPRARLAEGRVARRAGASAMMDVSDGLSIDLDRLARASGVGVRLSEVPVADGATLAEALGGGEDYELIVVTGNPEGLRAAFAGAGLRAPVRIGECTADRRERTLVGAPLARQGWEHPVG